MSSMTTRPIMRTCRLWFPLPVGPEDLKVEFLGRDRTEIVVEVRRVARCRFHVTAPHNVLLNGPGFATFPIGETPRTDRPMTSTVEAVYQHVDRVSR